MRSQEEEMYYRNIRFIQNQTYRSLMTRFGVSDWCLYVEQ